MTRSRAIAYATEYFDSGAFLADLTRRVAFPTESALPERRQDMHAYLAQEIVPAGNPCTLTMVALTVGTERLFGTAI